MNRFAALIVMILLAAEPAHAYIGPGSGLAFLGTLLALVGAVAVALVGFIWYPIKRLLSRRDPDEDTDEA